MRLSSEDQKSYGTLESSEGVPVTLPVFPGPAHFRPRHTILSSIHFFLITLAILIRLPFHLLGHFVLFRWRSSRVQELGRSPLVEATSQLSHLYFHRGYLKPSRWFFSTALPDRWVGPTFEVNGTKAHWIAPPGTEDERGKEDLIVLWVHGGAFVHDTSPICSSFFVRLVKTLNQKQNVKVSFLMVDYRLAPEFLYPTPILETLAAYCYLVNELGVSESKICIAGDSAGGAIAASVLLHLARPNPKFTLPAALGKTPKKPASAILCSPFISLVSTHPSRTPVHSVDMIEDGGLFHATLSYLGVFPPYTGILSDWKVYTPTWNPIEWFRDGVAADLPPLGLIKDISVDEAEAAGGLDLLSSPYVNPSPAVVKDLAWYAEALPSDGRTLVAWGGKEIFADDITEFVEALKQVEVNPTELYKHLGVHEWPLFDVILPTSSQSKDGGKWDVGFNQFVKFLVEQAQLGRQ